MALRQAAGTALKALGQAPGLKESLFKLATVGAFRQLSTCLKDVVEAKIPEQQVQS